MDKKLTYVTIGLAVVALALAVYNIIVSTQTPTTTPPQHNVTSPSPSNTQNVTKPEVKVNFYDITIDYPGYWRAPLGWVYTSNDVIFYLNVVPVGGGEVLSVYIDGLEFKNPVTTWLTPGNHTIELLFYAPGRIQFKIEYRVGT